MKKRNWHGCILRTSVVMGWIGLFVAAAIVGIYTKGAHYANFSVVLYVLMAMAIGFCVTFIVFYAVLGFIYLIVRWVTEGTKKE